MDDALMAGMVAGAAMASAAAVLGELARRMARETLPLNRWAGLRTPLTMRSPEAWRVGHRAAARSTALGALAFGAAAVASIVAGAAGSDVAVAAAALSGAAAGLAALGWGWRQAVRGIRSAGLDT
jgi:hypothetical protein